MQRVAAALVGAGLRGCIAGGAGKGAGGAAGLCTGRGGGGAAGAKATGGAVQGADALGSNDRVDSLRLRKVEHIVCFVSHDAGVSS